MRSSLGPLVGVLVLFTIACGSDSSTGTPTSPISASVTFLQISGNTDLQAVGQTTQLSLTTNFSDGTKLDSTTDATWSSNPSGVVTVSRGLVTAVSLGVTTITALVGPRNATASVLVAPAGTFMVNGRVREPGSGSLAGVRVVEQISVTDTKTDGSGGFRFFVDPFARIRIELPDYEVFEREATRPPAPARSVFLDVPLQRTVRINSGLSRSDLQIAPNDVSYNVGSDLCEPCKLIRVISSPGTLTVRLAWTGVPAGALKLWVNGTRNSTTSSNMTVNAPTSGQSLVYVGWFGQSPTNYASFSLSVD